MALNRVREHATRLALPVPAGVKSGDPLVLGSLPCVAVVDRSEWTEDEASVQTDGSWRYRVHGYDGSANQALSPGTRIFLAASDYENANPDNRFALNADTGERFFGYLLEPVASGETKEVEVKVGY